MHRRDFLKTTAAGAAGGLQAAGTIRTGILGIQHSHLTGKVQAMRNNPVYKLVSVCEPDPETRKRRGELPELGGLRWVAMEELLGDSSLDLIVFEGEVKDAVPFATRVIGAGKHLHLEKPPTERMAPFEELVGLARRKKRRLQLGYIWRFHEGCELALRAMREGWLGEVFMIRATVNSDRDAKQRAVEARYPGGSMFELGGHMIDRVVACLGRPKAVRSWLRHDTSEADELKDNTLAVFEYDKALALIVSSAKMGGATGHRSFEVIGTDGSVMVQPMEPAPTVRMYLRTAHGKYRAGWQEFPLSRQPRFIKDFEELAGAIQEDRPLRYSYDHELLLQETLLRASNMG